MTKLVVDKPNKVKDRIVIITKNVRSLSAVAQELRQNALDFNRQRALAGVDIHGANLADLKPSTLKNRDGDGPPLAPRYAGSRIVTLCQVRVQTASGVIILLKSWPGMKFLKYHVTGTPNMAKRDPTGFSQEEKLKFKEIIAKHVTKKK